MMGEKTSAKRFRNGIDSIGWIEAKYHVWNQQPVEPGFYRLMSISTKTLQAPTKIFIHTIHIPSTLALLPKHVRTWTL
jgi:hypothetical protein